MELNDFVKEFREVIFKMMDNEMNSKSVVEKYKDITAFLAYHKVLTAFDKIVEKYE